MNVQVHRQLLPEQHFHRCILPVNKKIYTPIVNNGLKRQIRNSHKIVLDIRQNIHMS